MTHLRKVATRRALLVYNNFDVIVFSHRNRKNQVLALGLVKVNYHLDPFFL